MTSRAGSLIVAGFLGGLALVAVLVIVILIGDDDANSDAAVFDTSLREGDLVLLGEPTPIRVTVHDDEPVTGISLLVDGTPIALDAVPVADPGQGTFSATLTWVPDRLGFVTLTVKSISLNGQESATEFRVEVTDDAERVGARVGDGIQVTILSPAPSQRVAVNTPLAVLAQAQADTPLATFSLEVDGLLVAEQPAEETDGGNAVAVLEWTPDRPGLFALRVRVRAVSGAEGIRDLTVEVVTGENGVDGAPTTDDAAGADDSVDGGTLTIVSPTTADDIEFSDDLTLEISVVAEGTGRLLSIELYVNAILYESIPPEPLADGSYRLTIPFRPSAPGDYTIEVVVITEGNRRLDDRLDIRVLGEEDAESEQEEPDEQAIRLPDLVPIAIEVGENNAVIVTIANEGNAPVQSAPLLITVVRAADGIFLGETEVTLTLSRNSSRVVPLTVSLAEPLEITVIVDTANAVEELDETNNELSSVFQPLTRPDLVIQELQLSLDGIAIVRVDNVGAANFSGTIAVLLLFNGEPLEQLAFNGVLAVQGSLTLSGTRPIEGAGQLSAIVDPDNVIAEASESNNSLTITVGS